MIRLDPRGSVLQISGEDGLGAIDEEERTEARGSARGLVRPGAAGLLIGIECSRLRDSSWMYHTSLVTTRIGVELAAVQENYPTGL